MRPRLATLALALALVALGGAGCDSSNPGGSLRDLDGTYVLEELVFDPRAGGLANADVGARLDLPATQLTIYGGDGDAQLVSRFQGEGTRRTDLLASASRGRLTLTARAQDDTNELADLLLPSTFSLAYDATAGRPATLAGNVYLQSVNLERFDPDLYAGLNGVEGTLIVRFARQ